MRNDLANMHLARFTVALLLRFGIQGGLAVASNQPLSGTRYLPTTGCSSMFRVRLVLQEMRWIATAPASS